MATIKRKHSVGYYLIRVFFGIIFGIVGVFFLWFASWNCLKYWAHADYYAVKESLGTNPGLNDGYIPQGVSYLPEEDTYLHTARLYETTALVWANYDVAGREQISERRFLGLSSLSALTFEAIGAPLTDFQKSELVISDSISAISLMGVRDIEGEWTTLQAARVSCLEFNDLRNITYYEFARKVD